MIFRTVAMAFKSISHNKMRSFLTMLGIIIGVCSVITLVALIDGASRKSMENYEKMGTNIIDVYYGTYGMNPVDLTDALRAECAKYSEYIMGITPSSQVQTLARYRTKTMKEARITFASEDYDVCKNNLLSAGRSICYSDIENRVKVCVIGSYIQKEFFGLDDPINKKIKIKGVEYTVVGTYASKYNNEQWSDDNMIAVPMSLQRSITGSKKFESFTVKARDGESNEKALFYLKAFMARNIDKNNGYSGVYTNNSWMEQQKESNAMFTLLGGGVAGISLLVGGIGIMNIMLVSVAERTREIGIRMAIGAKRRSIISQFLVEAAAISACGGVLGIGLGICGAALLTAGVLKKVYLPSIGIMIGAVIFSVALGIFFGFYPANKASKMQPVEALRNQ